MTREDAKKMLKAKLECLKRETSGTDIDCNCKNCDECNLCYEQGNMGEQKEALELAIKALEQQSCEDCVSRKLLSDNLCEGISCKECSFNEIDGERGCLLQKRFDELPSVQPTRPTGKWIEKEDYNLDTYYECSECGADYCIEGDILIHKYCPNCGARMTSEDKE